MMIRSKNLACFWEMSKVNLMVGWNWLAWWVNSWREGRSPFQMKKISSMNLFMGGHYGTLTRQVRPRNHIGWPSPSDTVAPSCWQPYLTEYTRANASAPCGQLSIFRFSFAGSSRCLSLHNSSLGDVDAPLSKGIRVWQSLRLSIFIDNGICQICVGASSTTP